MTSERPKVVRACGVFHILTSKCASRHNSVHFFWHLNFQKWSGPGVFCTSRHNGVHFSDLATSKSAPTWGVFTFFTGKRASRHNGMHFFDISTSKSGPGLVRFCTFWLRNVLRATTACNFSSLICPAGSAPAALASLLFDPPEATHNENTVFRDFPTFSRTWIFFLWDFLFFDLLSSSLLFADSSYLCFSSVHIVGSLTSKLPSIICRLQTPHSPMLIILYPPIYLSPEDERKHWLYAAILTLGFQD